MKKIVFLGKRGYYIRDFLISNATAPFPIRVSLSEFCHILQVPDRISLALREGDPNIGGKVINKFVAP